jgi:uncharacterized protein YqeY
MTLKAQIQNDMKGALKAGDKERLNVVRLMMAAIKQIEVDQRIELDDGAVLDVLNKMVKQRRDSIAQFKDGGRNDLAEKEQAEIAVLETYLPEQLSADALDALVADAIAASDASSMRDMGKVMSQIKAQAEGRADMSLVSAKVKERLSG